nr:MAG TPA: hypothetical protein [Caudoviricetes sp.]
MSKRYGVRFCQRSSRALSRSVLRIFGQML